eukprot:TRINITY_DN81412_c0_g1_i1.p1 TRINITY_DN81412_c0_g1~~TRINITY_DN81412_c0_g1_i1.p1  ORF type:complete len:125 (+),score=28.21 TRINITY_DN81412_c0_g1_i1:39-377(+)
MARAPAVLLFLSLAFLSVLLNGCTDNAGSGEAPKAKVDCVKKGEECSQDFMAKAGSPDTFCPAYNAGLKCVTDADTSCCLEFQDGIAASPYATVLGECALKDETKVNVCDSR